MQVVEQFSDLSFIPCSFVAKDSSRKKRRSFKRPTLPSHDPVSTSLKTAAHHLFVTCRCFSHFSVLTKLDRIIPSYTQATNMELKPISIWKHEFARDVRYLLGFFVWRGVPSGRRQQLVQFVCNGSANRLFFLQSLCFLIFSRL